MTKTKPVPHSDMANAIRFLAMDAVEKAKSGHPGLPMGMADVATVLFRDFLKFDPKNPKWANRDRFVLSAGHGSMLLYSLLYLTGYEDMTLDQLKHFRQLGSRTAGHPEYGHASGIETTTGPLGQGISNAVGMVLSERLLAARSKSGAVDHFTYVFASDGDLMEGISHEAISFAGHLKLHKLIVFFDNNGISIDGETDLSVSDDQCKRVEASGWYAQSIDGHDPKAIHAAIKRAQASDRPSLIACRTTIAYGAPTKAGTAHAHGSPLGDKEIAGAREALKWPHDPFVIPEDILAAWRACGTDSSADVSEQSEMLDREKLESVLATLKAHFVKEKPNQGTRISSQTVLESLTMAFPHLIGGSADLTPSNNTQTKSQKVITSKDFSGSYIHYGVREHGMAAVMNGISLHGPFIPYGGTFLIFSDYLRPALRLSALSGRQVIYVLTHDSIGLGEDGPTHQPVEHLAALRAIPNLNVFRPADGVEVAECWALALQDSKRPSVIALTRQSTLPVRLTNSEENLCARGGYVVREPSLGRHLTIIATGSEVGLALEAQVMLEAQGVNAAVVSLPCTRLFDQQSAEYKKVVLGSGLRVGLEAATSWGWDRYIGDNGLMLGVQTFGASAPYKDIYAHFGLTADGITQKILEKYNAYKNSH